MTLFENSEDYAAFIKVVDQTWELVPLPIYVMVVMPNHWHFAVRPTHDDQVSEFFQRLTVTHTMRWHAHYKTSGTGHLYQGRFKSFPVQSDQHLLTVMRYVERNPVRAGLAAKAVDWSYGSAYIRQHARNEHPWLKSPVSLALPKGWSKWDDRAETESEIEALKNRIQRGLPYGDDQWTRNSVVRLGLESATRPRGRPRNET